MTVEVGEIEALFRYPVKSMRGERLAAAELGWRGLDGDRRLAFRRPDDRRGFPWLTASELPELILFTPERPASAGDTALPTHVRTPEGRELAVFGDELAAEVARLYGSPVQMTHLDRGIFDEATVSVIASSTVEKAAAMSAQPPDVRRFRPNILIRSLHALPFPEEEWVGGVLVFGDDDDAPAVGITLRDERCAIVNVDPDSGRSTPELLKAIVREKQNKVGVYGTTTRCGRLEVGQRVHFEPATLHPKRGRSSTRA